MQGIPPNNRNRSADPYKVYRNTNPSPNQRQFQMNSRQPPRPLSVQHSYVNARTGRPVHQGERIPAVNTLKAGGPRLSQNTLRQKQPQKKKRRIRRSQLRDYLFGLAVGLIIFGIAAIFVCQALLEMLIL